MNPFLDRNHLKEVADKNDMMRQWLEDQKFQGFIRFDAIQTEGVPTEHGVYAVVREGSDDPCFTVPGTLPGPGPDRIDVSFFDRRGDKRLSGFCPATGRFRAPTDRRTSLAHQLSAQPTIGPAAGDI